MSSSLSADLGELIMGILDNPATLWDHAFRSQLSADAQNILLALLFFPLDPSIEDLEAAAKALALTREGKPMTGIEFLGQLKSLEGTFVAIYNSRGETRKVRYFSPAIADFLLGAIKGSYSEIESIVDGVVFFDQLLGIWSAAQSLEIEKDGKRSMKNPGLSEWLESAPEKFLAAIERNWRSQSCLFQMTWVKGRWRDIRISANLEGRMLKILEIGAALESQEVLSWVEAHVRELAKGWLRYEGDRASAAALIGRMTVDPEARLAVRDWSTRSIELAEDFEAALKLREVAPDLLSEEFEERLVEAFDMFVQAQEEYIRSADDASDAESAIDEVNEVARRLGLEPGWYEDSLREIIYELVSREDDFDADTVREAHQYESAIGSNILAEDKKVDLLFDSLKRASEL